MENNISHTILTAIIGVAMAGMLAFEIDRRRKKLREVYNVLETEDRHVVADLEHMIELGLLKPYTGETLA